MNMKPLVAPFLCGFILVTAGCGTSNTVAPASSTAAPPANGRVSSGAGSGWTKDVTNSAMDGETVTASKESRVQSKDDSGEYVSADVICKVPSKNLAVTLKIHGPAGLPAVFEAVTDNQGRSFPAGRLKNKSSKPMSLAFWFRISDSQDVMTWQIKSDNPAFDAMVGMPRLSALMLAGYDLSNNQYGYPGSASFFYFTRPWIVEVMAGQNAVDIEIPINDAAIEDVLVACGANKVSSNDTSESVEDSGNSSNSNDASAAVGVPSATTSASSGSGANANAALSAPTGPIGSVRRVSPSFDCAKAATAIENMICSSDDLSRLDNQLGSAYMAKRISASDLTVLKKQQQDWVKIRNQCADAGCLKSAYETRILQLQQN